MDIPSVAAHQHGAFSRAQAVAAGYSADTIRGRLRRHRWERLLPSVFARAGTTTLWTRLHAVALWLPAGIISHGTALWLWDVLPEAVTVHVTVPRQCSRRSPVPWLRLHRHDLHVRDVASACALRVTRAERALLDCLCTWPAWHAAELLDRALGNEVGRRGLLSCYHSYLGREGSRTAGGMIGRAAPRAASLPERVLIRALRGAGMTGFRVNAPVLGFVADLLDPALRLVIEVDGWSTHGDRRSFQRDRERQNALVRAGYTVLRFTAADVFYRLDEIIVEIAATVAELRRRAS